VVYPRGVQNIRGAKIIMGANIRDVGVLIKKNKNYHCLTETKKELLAGEDL
jgi:hypothetical protein